MPLKVRVEERIKGVYAIHPEGSIDANTHTILGSEIDTILKKSPKMIIFDMANVSYISSAGLSAILVAEQSLQPQGGKSLLVNLPPHIRKVFDIVQALPPHQIFASVEELDRYLMEIQRKVKEGEMN